MQDKKTLIDFDGVIFDTEERIVQKKKQNSEMSWNEFFETVDWFQLLEEANVINNAISYILESQRRNKEIAILTKIHTVNERNDRNNNNTLDDILISYVGNSSDFTLDSLNCLGYAC